MTKREREILERLCVDGDMTEADLGVTNGYMRRRFWLVEPRLANGYFKAGTIPNAPHLRYWSITEAGRNALPE